MRVAILFSGHARNYEQYYAHIKEMLIDPNKHHDVDIFMHMWDRRNTDISHAKMRGPSALYGEEKVHVHDLMTLFKPTIITIEQEKEGAFNSKADQLELDEDHTWDMYYAIRSHYYKIWQVCSMCMDYSVCHNFSYDVVYNTRLDVVVHNPLPAELFAEPDTVYCSNGHDGGDSYVPDLILIGRGTTINWLSNLGDRLPEMQRRYRMIMHPEYYLAQYIKELELKLVKSPIIGPAKVRWWQNQ